MKHCPCSLKHSIKQPERPTVVVEQAGVNMMLLNLFAGTHAGGLWVGLVLLRFQDTRINEIALICYDV